MGVEEVEGIGVWEGCGGGGVIYFTGFINLTLETPCAKVTLLLPWQLYN